MKNKALSKLLCVTLSAMLVFGAAGCGSQTEQTGQGEETQAVEADATAEEAAGDEAPGYRHGGPVRKRIWKTRMRKRRLHW